MDDRLAKLLASCGFAQIHGEGVVSLWADEALRRIVRLREDDVGVELELLQDARYFVAARGPIDTALLRRLASDLEAHGRTKEGTDLAALEQAFTPMADELALELVYRERQAYSLCALRYAGDDAELELRWDNFVNELHARYRRAERTIDRMWKRGRKPASLAEWAAEVSIELRHALLSASSQSDND
jgi:hypothetical protein